MANKFLGLDSINVLTSYIDQAVAKRTENSLMLTIQAFKYFKFGEDVETPKGGAFNFNLGQIEWPDGGWGSLTSVIKSFAENGITIEDALSEGAIYVSSAIVTGKTEVVWSTPMRISGQNGVGVKFAYAYDANAEESNRTKHPQGVNVNNRVEYVWTKEDEGEWVGPTIWAMYSQDASDVMWRYCVTKDNVTPAKPSVGNTNWVSNLATQSLSEEYPYMWMSSQIVRAGESATDINWTEPILFGHYGQSGKDGRDGNAPNYNITLYKYSNGYQRPVHPTMGEIDPETGKYEFVNLEDFRKNNPDWLDVPSLEMVEEPEINVENVIEVGSIEELNENLVDGKILKLTQDLTDILPIVITEGNITIDLNGHNITAKTFTESGGNVIDDNSNSDSYVFWVKGGHLTIKGNGKAIAAPADYSMAVWSNGGDVTIKDGYYENGGESCTLIYGSARKDENGERIGSTITIYGGEFKATLKGEQAGTGDKRTALNTKNSDEDICKIVVYGGYFHEFDPSNNNAIVGSEKKSFLGDGVVATQNINGVFEVVDKLNVDIWWQCTVLIDGINNEVIKLGNVERYTAIDGTAKPGQYTMNLYAWSSNQEQPEMSDVLINGWRPANYNYLPDKPFDENGVIYPEYTTDDASLWMITANILGLDSNGVPIVNGAWSEPVKLTGPRGPISYDYRLETRYTIGTSAKPRKKPTEEEWTVTPPNTTDTYPYVWAVNYLVCYKMKYGEPDKNGETPIVEADRGTIIDRNGDGYFRVSGLNGEDGNKKNSIDVCNDGTAVEVKSFATRNLYISNYDGNSDYTINLDSLSFIDGYTGKFCNIGTGIMTISSPKMSLVGSCTQTNSIALQPQESVELVCYNNGNEKQLLVIGKSL